MAADQAGKDRRDNGCYLKIEVRGNLAMKM